MTDKQKIERLLWTLSRIACYPANSNSDPDVMGEALDKAQEWARKAIKAVQK